MSERHGHVAGARARGRTASKSATYSANENTGNSDCDQSTSRHSSSVQKMDGIRCDSPRLNDGRRAGVRGLGVRGSSSESETSRLVDDVDLFCIRPAVFSSLIACIGRSKSSRSSRTVT
jgi:hypothetical protein